MKASPNPWAYLELVSFRISGMYRPLDFPSFELAAAFCVPGIST